MKIANSSITMTSSHREMSYSYKESITMEAAASKDLPGAILSLSAQAESKSYMESMEEYKKQQEEELDKRRKENEQNAAQRMADQLKETNESGNRKIEISDEFKMKLEMVKRLFAMLKQGKKISSSDVKNRDTEGILDLRSSAYKNTKIGTELSFKELGTGVPQKMNIGTNNTGTLWQRVTASSEFMAESESTTFASKGIVQTSDGRTLDFHVEVSMSRAFMCQIDALETEQYIKTDPLMINLDTDIGTVSDQKFFFDLDADGKEESISFAGQGSGFLALDKNEDGIINDGSELFGTKSGDGFRDLSEYDDDKNGWIDENDAIFSKLKIWTKDKDGKDYLLDLKQADVGAIYLGNADTQFSIKNDEHKLNAEIKKTGIYLHEKTGAVGTMNHVDLVI